MIVVGDLKTIGIPKISFFLYLNNKKQSKKKRRKYMCTAWQHIKGEAIFKLCARYCFDFFWKEEPSTILK